MRERTWAPTQSTCYGMTDSLLQDGVLARSGCSDRLPQPRWLINSRHLFLTVLEAGTSKVNVPAYLVSGENGPPGSQVAISSMGPHLVEGVKELRGLPFMRR